MRLALARALAPVVNKLSTEAIRIRIGDSQGSIGQLRTDLADIKAHRVDTLGMSRLLYICECMGIDPWAAIAAAAPRRLAS
ncbi:hypothetical protein [uncultured Methylobacterium sp.]|uniref:hypothetical protein n=1 Tax=uncultured Methylobacterium sp. TaxID=157278 RepID=UPI0035CC7ACA